MKIVRPGSLAVLTAVGLWGASGHAATLSALPTIDPATEENLSFSLLGTPANGLWVGTVLIWDQTGDVTIEVDVLPDPTNPDQSTNYSVILIADNETLLNTPQTWSSFSLGLSGPATFNPAAPISFFDINGPVIPQASDAEILFDNLAWESVPQDAGRSILFGITVSEPIDNETVRLTLSPTLAVPEPTSGALFALGLFAASRRRRR